MHVLSRIDLNSRHRWSLLRSDIWGREGTATEGIVAEVIFAVNIPL